MKNVRLPKIVCSDPARAKRKIRRPWGRMGTGHKIRFEGSRNFMGGSK